MEKVRLRKFLCSPCLTVHFCVVVHDRCARMNSEMQSLKALKADIFVYTCILP
jgi:hypothetical protein